MNRMLLRFEVLGLVALSVGLSIFLSWRGFLPEWVAMTLAMSAVLLGLFQERRLLAPVARAVDQLPKATPEALPDALEAAHRARTEHAFALREQSERDALTGLPNRLALRQRLADWHEHSDPTFRSLALMFIDLDDFKRINDTLGHEVGDDVLAEIGLRLKGCLEEQGNDGALARFGGDEFVLLIEGPDARRRAGQLAESVLKALARPVQHGAHVLHVSGSIGVTSCPEDGCDPRRLLQNGDIAMYLAKVSGRNCYRYFTNYLTEVAADRLVLENDLRRAIELETLEVHYQPIVDLDTGLVAGAEALLRWNHPERGWISPTTFVGIAEDVGLIDALGVYVLERACIQATQWPLQGGKPPYVAVNVSARQLRDPGLPEKVRRALKRSGLDAAQLHLELTESAVMDGGAAARAVLAGLSELAVDVWLDDFGTGFSGLSHLRQVRVKGVKIDRSFTQDLLSDRHDLALTHAIIAMAHSLQIDVVAEGVESAAQIQCLRSIGCHSGQGFFLGQPMPPSVLLQSLRTGVVDQRYRRTG